MPRVLSRTEFFVAVLTVCDLFCQLAMAAETSPVQRGAGVTGTPVAKPQVSPRDVPSGASLVALGPAPATQNESRKSATCELRDGDRVVFLGNTLIEREQQTGHWETMLTTAWPERNITFRNLGWSGDTVWADSRGIFDNPATGYKRMIDQLKELKPTVVFLGYGGNEAFAGEEGLPRFQAQLDQLLAEIDALKARVVFLSPIRHENMGSPLPDPAEINAKLAVYTKALKEVAARRGEPFVDLYQPLPSREKFLESTGVHHLTNNGLHLTETGYIEMAHRIRESLHFPTDRWARAINNPDSPDGKALRNLREAIIEKNFLYFQNWRPQNVTYLFLFRKHEQGNNAGEVAEFQKLVVEQEKKTAELRKAWAATK